MSEKTAIITGASSGIGRATALRMAKEGFNLVLGARSKDDLEVVAATCRAVGSQAIAVEVDVADQQAVGKLAVEASEHFGGFDVWINNAGVTSVGAFIDTPDAIMRRVIETNFFGSMYGSREALRHFMPRKKGTLITVSSIFGTVPAPFESAYVASKFALRGFMGSLRQEVAAEGLADVHVCTVLPAAIDTPIYRNAANLTGKPIKPSPPLYSPQQVAETIVDLMYHPRAEVVVGGAGKSVRRLYTVLPKQLFDMLFARFIKITRTQRGISPQTTGNLFAPGRLAQIGGNWPRYPWRKVGGVVLSVAGIAAAVWLAHRQKERSSGRS
jgi:short-subunit dehydrogenase